MSTNPVSFRMPFESQIAKLPPEHQIVFRNILNQITDLQGAVPILKKQIDSNKGSISTVNDIVTTITTSGNSTPVSSAPTIGFINYQTSVTSYSTQTSDYGKVIVLNDASPIAVTLTTGITTQPPWFCQILNLGTGAATLTPATGTISYASNIGASSMPLAGGASVQIFYDGVNFIGF